MSSLFDEEISKKNEMKNLWELKQDFTLIILPHEHEMLNNFS